MSLTLELPRSLGEELTLESEREGIPAAEHATLLLYLATALMRDEKPTPFQKAVRVFLSHNSLDAAQVASVFESLVQLCLWHDLGKASPEFQKTLENTSTHDAVAMLRQWRNTVVHRAADISPQELLTKANPAENVEQRLGRSERQADGEEPDRARVAHVRSIRGKYAHLGVTSDDVRRERESDEEASERQLRGLKS